MDVRLLAYYEMEAGAIHRQEMARIAVSVSAGFSDKAGFQKFMNGLELTEPGKETYNETWEMLYAMKRG